MESNRRIQFEFVSSDGRDIKFQYELFSNPFIDKWWPRQKDAFAKPSFQESFHSDFYGVYFTDKSIIVDSINQSIKTVNEHGYRRIEMRASEEMGPDFLNSLHEIFEHYVVDPKFQPEVAGNDVYEALKNINVQIHRFESFFFPTHQGFIITRTDKEFSAQLEPEDLQYFTPEFQFGNLYLAYQTVGIAPLQGYYNRIDHRPTPQSRYTTTMHLSFDPDSKFYEWDEYKRWMREDKEMDPDDPKNTFGLIPLGKLIDPVGSPKEIEEYLYRIRAVRSLSLSEDGNEIRPNLNLYPPKGRMQNYRNFLQRLFS